MVWRPTPPVSDTIGMADSTVLGSHKLMAFVATRDPDRAKRFYRDNLGLHLVAEQLPFALVFDAHGTMLRVTIVHEIVVAPYTVLGWEVPGYNGDSQGTHGRRGETGAIPGHAAR